MPNYKLHHFKSLKSTQDKAKEFSEKGLSGIVVIVDAQTEGRGRLRRKWHSSKGGLWMSILLKPSNTEKLQYLTFAAAVSVVMAIKKTADIDAKIKWPNDVHYNGRKLCGILTECIFGKENHAIVGIGINVNQTSFPDEIDDTATSLKIIKNSKFKIKDIAKNIINEFLDIYNNQYEKNKFRGILNAWKRHCDTINKNVAVISRNGKTHGKAIGVDDNCNLLLKSKNGEVVKISEGDVSVRYN